MTKPKARAHRLRKGRPAFPTFEMYVRFEATRRIADKSINAHTKTFVIYLIGGHLALDGAPRITGEALRRHINNFRRAELNEACPASLAAYERLIEAEIAMLKANLPIDGSLSSQRIASSG